MRRIALVLVLALGACGGGEDRADWFKGCPAAQTALAGLTPTAPVRPLDPLEDVLPTSADGFESALNAPVPAGDRSLPPWLQAGLQSAGAGDGYAAVFSHGEGGPAGGWSAYAFPHRDPSAARKAASNAYTALVCRFDGEPWAVPGTVAAATDDTAQVLWTSDRVLFVAEGADKAQAETAAAAVRAQLAG